jgi:hypothetical protein
MRQIEILNVLTFAALLARLALSLFDTFVAFLISRLQLELGEASSALTTGRLPG